MMLAPTPCRSAISARDGPGPERTAVGVPSTDGGGQPGVDVGVDVRGRLDGGQIVGPGARPNGSSGRTGSGRAAGTMGCRPHRGPRWKGGADVMTDVPAALGLSPRDTAAVLETAGLAPSVHNTQPWAFCLKPEVIELHADPARRLPVADGHDRELRIACGAALFNLRLALHGRGVRPDVTRFPDRGRPGLIADVRRGGTAPIGPETIHLLAAVGRRRTNRHPFSEMPVASPQQQELCRAADIEGSTLHLVHDPDRRRRLSELARRAHRTQMADPAFRAELAAWTGTPAERHDGVPVSASGPLPAPQDRWVLRDFTAGTGRDRVPGKDFEDEPLIAVLTATLSGALGDVQAGEALQRVLLTATVEGLAVSFLSQLVEVPDVRDAVERLVGTIRPPAVVLRIGYGWPTTRTLRRPVADLLVGPHGPVGR
jgi:hypothetical protein